MKNRTKAIHSDDDNVPKQKDRDDDEDIYQSPLFYSIATTKSINIYWSRIFSLFTGLYCALLLSLPLTHTHTIYRLPFLFLPFMCRYWSISILLFLILSKASTLDDDDDDGSGRLFSSSFFFLSLLSLHFGRSTLLINPINHFGIVDSTLFYFNFTQKKLNLIAIWCCVWLLECVSATRQHQRLNHFLSDKRETAQRVRANIYIWSNYRLAFFLGMTRIYGKYCIYGVPPQPQPRNVDFRCTDMSRHKWFILLLLLPIHPPVRPSTAFYYYHVFEY